jgi:hypothetical protein
MVLLSDFATQGEAQLKLALCWKCGKCNNNKKAALVAGSGAAVHSRLSSFNFCSTAWCSAASRRRPATGTITGTKQTAVIC